MERRQRRLPNQPVTLHYLSQDLYLEQHSLGILKNLVPPNRRRCQIHVYVKASGGHTRN